MALRYSTDYDPDLFSRVLGEVVLAVNAIIAGTTGPGRGPTGPTGPTGP